ncbi:MAG: tetratricopeptide repeat protein [Sandaracinaceae bacterium]|nr:tetratricopeptide repeat protein [Sandaracinaceae bacterium]
MTGSESHTVSDARVKRIERVGLSVVMLALLLACGHAVRNELVWDDLYVIQQGDVIFHPEKLAEVFSHRTMFISSNDAALTNEGAQTYRPVTVATFFWDAWLSGRSPTAYHLTNLAAHLITVLMVFTLSRALLPARRRRYALFAAAWFGLQPQLAEAHVWINGRSDVFSGLFALAAVLVWMRGMQTNVRGQRIAFHALASISFLLALLSKEPAIGVIAALLAWPHVEKTSLAKRLLSLAPFAVATLVYFVLRTHALNGLHVASTSASLATALLRAPALLADGFVELTLPTRVYVRALGPDYDALGTSVLIGIGVITLLVLVSVAYFARRTPRVGAALAWFVFTLLPAAFVTTTLWPGFGRFLYLPAIGLAPLIAEGVAVLVEKLRARAERTARLALICACSYLVFLGLRLHLYVYDWRNEASLYQSWIAGAPDRPHGYGWLGYTYLERGDAPHAIPLLAEAARRSPQDERFQLSLGTTYLSLGLREQALATAREGLRVHARRDGFYALLAQALFESDREGAADALDRCLRETQRSSACQRTAQELTRDDQFNTIWNTRRGLSFGAR